MGIFKNKKEIDLKNSYRDYNNDQSSKYDILKEKIGELLIYKKDKL